MTLDTALGSTSIVSLRMVVRFHINYTVRKFSIWTGFAWPILNNRILMS